MMAERRRLVKTPGADIARQRVRRHDPRWGGFDRSGLQDLPFAALRDRCFVPFVDPLELPLLLAEARASYRP